MSCRCMKFASRSAMLSESSAKAGSKEESGEEVLYGLGVEGPERREVRDEGRSGVVGREGGLEVEVERLCFDVSMAC